MAHFLEGKLAVLSDAWGRWWENGFPALSMTNNLYPYRALFSPLQVNSVTLKNRIIMAPMGCVSISAEGGRLSADAEAFFSQRAKGGAGLIIVGAADEKFVDGARGPLKKLAEICHDSGCRVFLEITPGLGMLAESQTKFLADAAAEAAFAAQTGGMDGVCLNLVTDYIDYFKSGKDKAFFDIAADMVYEIRQVTGDNFPIMCRVDLSRALEATYGDKLKSVKALKKQGKERTVLETIEYLKELTEVGADMFDIGIGSYQNVWLKRPTYAMPAGCYLDLAEIVKKHFRDHKIKSRRRLPVPIVCSGKLGYPDVAEAALKDKRCDAVMLGRPLLADPDWPIKVREGRASDIKPCAGCSEGCVKSFQESGHLYCSVAPEYAPFDEFGGAVRAIKKTEQADNGLTAKVAAAVFDNDTVKKCLVAGAGVAGIAAAVALADRGHRVEIFEPKDIGGRSWTESKLKNKYDLNNYVWYLKNLVQEYAIEKKIKFIKAPANPEIIKAREYDVVITATGAKPSRPALDGASGKNVVFAEDVIMHPEMLYQYKSVAILGGNAEGAELALYLAWEHNKKVSLIDRDYRILQRVSPSIRTNLTYYLGKAGVKVFNGAKVTKIAVGKVAFKQNMHKSMPDPYDTWAPEKLSGKDKDSIKEKYADSFVEADLVVIAGSYLPDDSLYIDCVKERVAREIYNVGDSLKAGTLYESVRSAYRLAKDI